jgi:GNAT superfamily N-acetyltransferase
MILEKYIPGKEKNAAFAAISDMVGGITDGRSYASMMARRISGAVAHECCDTFYVAHEDGKAASRLWMGWGRHKDAIGNWGNFYTVEAYRRRGIGGGLLKFWYEDFQSVTEPPLCFWCTTGSKDITDLYGRFGFRPAIEGREYGPLYRPNGNSPATFREFYTAYYQPSEVLYLRPATVEYRHEIDCLLKFAFRDLGMEFGIGQIKSVESALLYHADRCGMLFSRDGHCVGWSMDGVRQVYPLYQHSLVIEEHEIPTGAIPK